MKNPPTPSLDHVLHLLRCPITKSPLRRVNDTLESACGSYRYPIRNGIAVLLADEAKTNSSSTQD
jgi:uncharacterized protein YbaR (Trm112 family)